MRRVALLLAAVGTVALLVGQGGSADPREAVADHDSISLRPPFQPPEDIRTALAELDGGTPAGLFEPGVILVKLKDKPGRGLDGRLATKRSINPLDTGITSLDLLNRQLNVARMEPVFPALKAESLREGKNHVQLAEEARSRFPERAARAGVGACAPNLLNIWRVEFQDLEQDPRAVALEYAKDPAVEYAEPNVIHKTADVTPDDPYFSSSGSWGQSYDDLWNLKRISAGAAWEITTGSSDITIAIVDTGLDYDHEDLEANIWLNSGEMGVDGNGDDKRTNSVDDDGNGYIDDWRGWDTTTCTWFTISVFGSTCNEPKSPDNDASDEVGHGTHVAGTAGAVTDNGQGIAGVSWSSKLMAVQVLARPGVGYTDWLVDGIYYAVANGADVINMSLGGQSESQTRRDAINYAYSQGVVVVASAGNDSGADVRDSYPARYGEVITVTSSDENDVRSSFANTGTAVDVAAPGGGSTPYDYPPPADTYINILSLRADQTDMYGDGSKIVGVDQKYYRARGTSMAAPHVAGAAALLLSVHPGWDVEMVRQAIRAGADDIMAPGWDPDSGYGRLNLEGSLTLNNVCSAHLTSPEPYQEIAIDTTSLTISGFVSCASGPATWTLELGHGIDPDDWTTLEFGVGVGHQEFTLALDPQGWPAMEAFTFRLRVTNEQAQTFEDRVLVEKPQPLKEGWILEFADGSTGSPGLVPAQNGEALAFGENDFASASSLLHLLDPETAADITPGWPVQLTSAVQNDFNVSIGELDPNRPGLEQVYLIGEPVADDNPNFWIHLYDAQGQEIGENGWPRFVGQMSEDSVWFMNAISISDLNMDGVNEVVFITTEGVEAWTAGGTPVFQKPVPGIYYSPPAVANLDADPANEVIVVGSDGIHALNLDGSEVAGWWPTLPLQFGDWTTVTAADLEGDARDEVIVLFDVRFTEPEVGSMVAVLGPDGTTLPGWPKVTGPIWSPPFPAVGDLDADGWPEIVVAGISEIYAYDPLGNILAGWPVSTDLPLQVPILADIDGDLAQEVFLVGSFQILQMYGYRGDGWRLPTFPLDLPEAFLYGSPPIIGDMDEDGQADIVNLGSAPTMLSVFEFPTSHVNDMDWPTFRADMARSGSKCLAWPNPGQSLPPWSVPPGDDDCDGWATDDESFLVTLPFAACPATSDPNDEDPDAWPPDLNDDQICDIEDITQLTPPYFNSTPPNPLYSQRKDLNADGVIDIEDFNRLTPPTFNQSCT